VTDPGEPLEGKVVPPRGKTGITALDGFRALQQVVEGARECFLVHEEEKSKRVRLDAYQRVEVERIRAAESVLKSYFNEVFRERRSVLEDMFVRLDTAMEKDDGQAIHDVLRGIVDVAQSSPIADLGDLGQIRRALDDPDHEWEL
jgi:hypothetical protein